MLTRTTLSIVLLASMVGIAGCDGPTKAGKEAREQANERVNLMSAQISFDQARQAFEVGQFDRAMRDISLAIARYPKMPDYHVLQGRINMETHRLEDAVQSFNKAIEIQPEYAEAHYFSGIVYQRWSDDEQAYQCYTKAFEIEPTKVQYLLAAAESMIALGEFDAANQLIDSKVTYFEHNAALRQLQAQIALLQSDPGLAVELFGEARLLNPDDNSLLEEQMWAQYAANQFGPCHESAEQLQQRLGSNRNDILHLQARCLAMMDRTTEARELYLELAEKTPSDPVIWSELGMLAWDIGDYRRVAECSVRITSLAPQRYDGYMLRGINERHKGNSAEAIRLFKQAADRATDCAMPHLMLGQALEGRGDAAGARAAYAKAIEVEPSNDDAHALLNTLGESQRITVAPTQ